jgi:hypothetical protein
MRLLNLCAGYRPRSHYLNLVNLGVELALAVTLCALLLRAVVLL